VNYLVTGTDTGVGKTFVTSGLVRFARSRGLDSVGMKPICTGDNDDVRQLLEACSFSEPEHLINPVWYRTPLAPYVASIIEDRLIDVRAICQAFEKLATRHVNVLVEGSGGVAVPILADYDFRDLAREIGLHVIIVAANRLGVLNHTRLTVEAVRSAGLDCSLVALNSVPGAPDISQATNLGIIESLMDVPVVPVEQNQREFGDIVGRLFRYPYRPGVSQPGEKSASLIDL
jgi:dethiobiotin synthetase